MKTQTSTQRYSSLYITFLSLVAILAAIPLLYSIFSSGYGYQFDMDELHHVNLVYLYAHGFAPYKDIYTSFYTPLFEWTLLPVFLSFGFSMKTVIFSRFIMILMYCIRLFSVYILVKTLWSRRAALLFIPLLIFDPFAVLSSFQLRTDNFMLMLYSVGIAVVTLGITKQKRNTLLLGSFILGASALSLPKILPAVFCIILTVSLISVSKKKISDVALILFCTLLPTLLFLLYGTITGSLYEMVQQIVIEATSAYAVFRAPLPFGAIFYPNNIWIYGTMGKPVTWMYVWVLPLLGAGGLFAFIKTLLSQEKIKQKDWIKAALAATLVVQFTSLILLPVVFMQHYLLINWLYAVFAAVFFDDILSLLERYTVIYLACCTLLCAAYLSMAHVSYGYNISRSTIHGQELFDTIQKRFAQIQENESVFPHFLFRPSIFPIPYGYYIGNVPPEVLARLPNIPKLLEDKQVNKLLFDEYTLNLMPTDVQLYIAKHYARIPGDTELMIRK